MKNFVVYIVLIIAIIFASYIGQLFVPYFQVFDGTLNSYEELYINGRSFIVQGLFSAIAIILVHRALKISKFTGFNILGIVVTLWFIVGCIREQTFNWYLLNTEIIPFVLGSAAGVFLVSHIGHLTSKVIGTTAAQPPIL